MSTSRKRIVWTVVFLSVTLAAIVMEVVAGIFHPAGTIPWTEYLARYVPWPIQLGAYVALAVWLPFHFWRHDHLRKVAQREALASASAEDLQRELTARGYYMASQLQPGGVVYGATRFKPGRSDGR